MEITPDHQDYLNRFDGLKPRYAKWIRRLELNAAKTHGLRQRCRESVLFMCEVFPELTAVPGKVTLRNGDRICHWWAVTASGQIIDPTAAQFESWPQTYVAMVDEIPAPTGQCWYCGDYRYGASRYCSKRCGRRWRKEQGPTGELALMFDMLRQMHGGDVAELREAMG